MSEILQEKIEEIEKFAQNNNDMVSYNVAVDILKDRSCLADDEIMEAIRELTGRGILITPENPEEYPATETNPEAFIAADVNISQKPVNIYNLMERLENNEIDLSPSFQRHGNLWRPEQQSRLIESLMLKIPIPAFYFNASDDDFWVVIDGLQRLTAFSRFLVGTLDKDTGTRQKEKFVGLQYLRDFNGHTFDDLPRQYVRRIKETPVIAYTVEKGTPDEIVFNIFQRINTGGIALNDQEIRQALYQGKSTRLIEKLAQSEAFISATQGAIQTERMQNREFVLRFIAFTELDYQTEYEGNIDSYLIKTMKAVNSYEDSQIRQIEERFARIMRECASLFGRYAFRKYDQNKRRGPINKALFEAWSICLSELSEEALQKLVDRKEEVLNAFGALQKNEDFVSALKAGDQYSTGRRIDMIRKMIKELL